MKQDAYNIGAKEEMRLVSNAIARAIQVDRSVSGFVHCACYAKNMMDIAIEKIQYEGF